ncbi:hypothetical protein B0A48_05321 [Cryoendolithus antarcticus]|uniref:Acyltransferase MbtK/IucB-like conserved domain-containing protein n=1 Tax=Cryoendolithus antarcticus TaxID=1507870 RepID=A0A1V8TI78_9PEZI|nr:hypothetical protein B0A48_05321 [Cryoendolithus antarcticus]
MAPSIVHLPNGQTLSVTPSFGGLYFKSNDLALHHSAFPPGFTIILHSEDSDDDHTEKHAGDPEQTPKVEYPAHKQQHIHRYRKPTLRNDHLFISSISNPNSNDFRPPTSPTRQIAMMLWATLWWYFHQPEPAPQLTTSSSANTTDAGKPKGEWRININREGIFKGKHTLPKLERMGLIATEDSSVGVDPDDGVGRAGEGFEKMFVSRRTFWQLDARIYLFTQAPLAASSPYPSMSPAGSRPSSPNRNSNLSITSHSADTSTPGTPVLQPTSGQSNHWRSSTPPGPFTSASHLPTFYPPPPTQYTWTGNVRHPIRPKPPRQGETFYTRYIPSLGQYLSFRVASLSAKPISHRGPTLALPDHRETLFRTPHSSADSVPTITGLSLSEDNDDTPTTQLTDCQLLHKWMNNPRVAASWGETGPLSHQTDFLSTNLASRSSFPVIGCFDGKPFGYFEIYWVKESTLAPHCEAVGEWDRGLHVLVGEQEFRGSHRVGVWLSALVHYCWLADLRTGCVFMEPRVDNEKLKHYCESVGFFREKEVSFPHKHSNLMKLRREAWDQPVL